MFLLKLIRIILIKYVIAYYFILLKYAHLPLQVLLLTAISVTGCSAVIHYSNNYSYRVFAPLESNHFLHFSSNNIDETRFVYVFITMLHHDTVWKSTASVSK